MIGKPYTAALNDDLPDAISTIRYYGGYADKFFGQTIPTTPLKFAYTLRQPIGVIGQIIPWNYPLSMYDHSPTHLTILSAQSRYVIPRI